MSAPVTFAIVGCGRIAQRHAEHIQAVGRLVAVCDNVPEKALALAEKTGANSYTDFPQMLAHEPTIDVVAICTPNYLHAPQTLQALRAGFHVVCEKPMALSSSDCGQMISTALETNKRLFIIKQNRYNPPIEALKRVIDEGKLGRILSVQLNCFWNRNADYYLQSDWKGKKDKDGGTLFTQFSHFIDLLYWLVGDVKEANALIGNYTHHDTVEFEDSGAVILEFANGAIGTIHYTVNSFGKNMEGSITVFGEKGTVKVGGQYLNELEYQVIDHFTIEGLSSGNKANDYGFYQGSMSNHDKVYQNVVDVMRGSATISTNGFEGMKTVEIIEKIYHNAKSM
jgi:UDP-N-acetyl-2-amino-2-deoxyglucuronate dehydrogenase